MKKIDWTKYIGYFMFAIAVIGWAISYGKQAGRADRIEKSQVKTEQTMEEIKKSILQNREEIIKQSTLNEFIITYIERSEK